MATPVRSKIPQVIGILMIVFSSLGLVSTLSSFAPDPEVTALLGGAASDLQTWEKVTAILSFLLGALHLMAGILAVRYRPAAIRFARLYGIAAIASTVAVIATGFIWLLPALDAFPGVASMVVSGMVLAGVVSIAWPVVVIVLMSRPAAKQACGVA